MVIVDGHEVTFEFLRPEADRVFLAGDFNGWRAGELPMRRDQAGLCKARLHLPKGTFRFRYLADGQWYADFASFGVDYGPYGPNGVVEVAS
jgi:1,4-alpha-glucan branching enzyme